MSIISATRRAELRPFRAAPRGLPFKGAAFGDGRGVSLLFAATPGHNCAMSRGGRFSGWRSGLALGLAAGLAGCSGMSQLGFDAKSTFGSVSLTDRCTDFMHRAFPDSPIEVRDSHIDAAMNRATVTIDATRDTVPADSAYARDIAVECRFENGVLTGFRWTKGPLRP